MHKKSAESGRLLIQLFKLVGAAVSLGGVAKLVVESGLVVEGVLYSVGDFQRLEHIDHCLHLAGRSQQCCNTTYSRFLFCFYLFHFFLFTIFILFVGITWGQARSVPFSEASLFQVVHCSSKK
jgi:hypothetical protein